MIAFFLLWTRTAFNDTLSSHWIGYMFDLSSEFPWRNSSTISSIFWEKRIIILLIEYSVWNAQQFCAWKLSSNVERKFHIHTTISKSSKFIHSFSSFFAYFILERESWKRKLSYSFAQKKKMGFPFGTILIQSVQCILCI